MATGILRAFGLSDEQLARAKTAWQTIPVAEAAHNVAGAVSNRTHAAK